MMDYRTRSTLLVRAAGAPNVIIYIPPVEQVQTQRDEACDGSTVLLRWRGLLFTAEPSELERSATRESRPLGNGK